MIFRILLFITHRRGNTDFAYGDTHLLQRLIDEGEGSHEQKERQRNSLREVVQFCMNKTDCRRAQILHYFGERTFTAANCHRTCDNCNRGVTAAVGDFTTEAKNIIGLVDSIQKDNVTLLHCVDVFRGSRAKNIVQKEHDKNAFFGQGKHLERGDVERLFQIMTNCCALKEKCITNGQGFTNAYMRVGIS